MGSLEDKSDVPLRKAGAFFGVGEDDWPLDRVATALRRGQGFQREHGTLQR